MARTIGYLRVSTDEQLNGFGLDAQLDAIRNAVGEPDAVFRDEGISGAIEDRPGLLAALEALGEGDVLVVAERSRLARDMFLSCWIQKEVKRRQARILSAKGEGTEGDDPASILLGRMIDAFAEFERAQIVEKLRVGRQQARKHGRKMGGKVPFGYEPDGKYLRIHPEEHAALRMIRQWRADGWTLRQIAGELERRGIRSKRGGTRWHPQTVKQCLEGLTDEDAVRRHWAEAAG